MTSQTKDDPFADIRDRFMSALNEEQTNRAYELWIRDNLGYMNDYNKEHYSRLLAVIDRLRARVKELEEVMATVCKLPGASEGAPGDFAFTVMAARRAMEVKNG